MASPFGFTTISRRALLGAGGGAFAALMAACSRASSGGSAGGQTSSAPAASTPAGAASTPAGKTAAPQATTQTAGAPAVKAATGEVRFWYPWEDRAQSLLKAQQAAQPDLKLKFEVGEFDSNTKTMAVLAAGNPPDVSFLGRWQTCDLAVRNGIFALDDRIKGAKAFKWTDVWERLQKDSTSWGKIWIVPYTTDTRAMYYNKTLMKEAGLDPEKPPTTWTDLVDMAVKTTVKDNSGKLDRIGFTPTFGNPPTFLMFYSMLWMLNSDIADDGRKKVTLQEKGNEAMTMVKEMMDRQGGYEAAAAFTKGLTLGEGLDAFSTGKVTLAMNTQIAMVNIDKYAPNLNFGIAPGVTAPSNTYPLNYDGGGGLFYFKQAKNPEGAWALTEFLMGKDFYLNYTDEQRFMPTLKPVAEEWAKRDKRRQVFVATANTVRWIPIVVGTLDMLAHISKMWDNILYGKEPAERALKTAADAVQQILDKHNSYPPPQG